MSMPRHVKGTGIYFIVEKIYAKSGLPALWNTVGGAAIQVVRTIYEVCHFQDIYLDDEKIDYDNITLWQTLRILYGHEVISKNTPEVTNNLIFCGTNTYIVPLPNLNDNLLGEKITKLLSDSYHVNFVAPLGFGQDPIPDIQLYGRLDINFISSSGGLNVPTAIAKYNKKTREVVIISSVNEMKSIMNSIR